jgi:tRNA A37 methylthiotransferase MiaB
MNELLKQISKNNNKKEIWSTKTMLINEISEDGSIHGYTDNMKQITVQWSADNLIGSIVPVTINGAGEFKLQGQVD